MNRRDASTMLHQMYNFYPKKLVQPPGCAPNILLIMKLTTFLVVLCMLQVSARTLAQKITLSEKNTPLNKIFEKISNQTGYDFIISTNNLKSARLVTITIQNEELTPALAKIFATQPLTFVIQDKIVVISQRQNTPQGKRSPSFPVSDTITGRVTDTLGTPLPGATITVKGTNKTTLSDRDGKFTIDAIAGDEVTISFIGYSKLTLQVLGNHQQNYVLHAVQSQLNEVNVISTGYQTLPKERATGSFAQIDNQLYNRRTGADVLSRLEGVVPGLVFNRNTVNSANGSADISIRGTSTLFAGNQPLIVVDGFPYDGDIANINPNIVDNVTVLKDAAAASIWGVRSGNGVIVITTKKGRRNQALSIDLNANITVSTKPDLNYNPNFLPSDEFISLERQSFGLGFYDAALISPTHTAISSVVQLLADQRAGKISQASLNNELDKLQNNDVRRDLSRYFYRSSVAQQYALNLKGGGDKSEYFLGLGYDRSIANRVGNKNDRATISAKYNFYPIPDLQISAGINYIQSNSATNSPVDDIRTGGNIKTYPYAVLADQNGNALPIVKNFPASYTDTVGKGKLLDWNYRPINELHNNDNNGRQTDNRVNLGLKYNLPLGITAQVTYQYQRSETASTINNNVDSYYARNLINNYAQMGSNGLVTYPIPVGGILQSANSYLNSNRIRGQLDYQNKFGKDHEVNAIIGSEISSTVTESNAYTVYGYDKNNVSSNGNVDYTTFYTLMNGNADRIPNSIGFGKQTDRFVSYYANASYIFKNRYIATGSTRIDKSNLFGVNTNQKGVPLYSAGLAWNAGQEPFYKINWLPYLKLRATFGYNGNINTGATAVTTIRQFDPILNGYSAIPYSRIVNPGNPELRWERIRMINLGGDFGFLGNVVTGSFEYYFKKGNDLFGYSPLAPSTGISSFFGNTADIKGKGFDLVINTHNIKGVKFNWTTNLLFSHATDIVTHYSTTLTSSNYISLSNASSIYPLEGKNLFALYSYKWAGLDPLNGEPRGFLPDGSVSSDYSRILGETGIEQMDYKGSSRPQYFGSFRNTFFYKGFSISANIVYKLDYYFRRNSYSSAGLPWSGHTDYLSRWQKPGDELKTDIPSLQLPPYNNNRDAFYSFTSALIEKGDHIRLQDITLGYDWGKATFKQLPFRHIQIYAYFNNVGILWRANRHGLDPDLLVGSSLSAFPTPKTCSLGLKLTP
ncbi:hypothetical protein A0256_00150 [Mucilaginibacter sp. PAMC 26640]|nr:hypothetical protein A0256_00150 [Mucilaginibacter sp. PAMC 26640]